MSESEIMGKQASLKDDDSMDVLQGVKYVASMNRMGSFFVS